MEKQGIKYQFVKICFNLSLLFLSHMEFCCSLLLSVAQHVPEYEQGFQEKNQADDVEALQS